MYKRQDFLAGFQAANFLTIRAGQVSDIYCGLCIHGLVQFRISIPCAYSTVGSTDAVVGSTAGAGDSAGAVSVGASVGSTVASVVVISVDSTELVSVAVTEVVSVLAVLLLVVSLLPHEMCIRDRCCSLRCLQQFVGDRRRLLYRIGIILRRDGAFRTAGKCQ